MGVERREQEHPERRGADADVGNGRQRPVRLIIWPAMIDDPNTPKNNGTSNRPELLADTPFAIWRNVGSR